MARASFLGWTWVSYFFLCGGVMVAAVALAALEVHEPTRALAGLGAGAALGGFFAGRASPHDSYLEPAIAGVLLVGSVVAMVWATPMGRLAIAMAEDQVETAALVAGGVAFVGGFGGSVVGEMTRSEPSDEPLRWIGIAVWLAIGALFVALVIAAGLLVNEAAENAVRAALTGRDDIQLIDQERVVAAVALAMGGMSVLAGSATQLAAPRRMLAVSALGAPIVLGGLIALGSALEGTLREMAVPVLVVCGLSLLAALLGAALAFAGRKMTGSL